MDNLYELMKFRRSVRRFDSRPVEPEKIERIIQAGIYAPSGSNKSPFIVSVIRNKDLKTKIREEAEAVEKKYYERIRAKKDTEFLNWVEKKKIRVKKPFLTEAPVLLSVSEDTTWRDKHSNSSTWLTIAYMVLAIEYEGLASVTYTPEPHDFIRDILGLDKKYQPQVILPVGYAKNPVKKIGKRPSVDERVIYFD